MAAAFVVETERWNLATDSFLKAKLRRLRRNRRTMSGGHGGHSAAPAAPQLCVRRRLILRCRFSFVVLPRLVMVMRSIKAGGTGRLQSDKIATQSELEIAALSASMKKDHGKAIELMKKATALEEQMSPPYGPPNLVKPTHELFGEILLRQENRLRQRSSSRSRYCGNQIARVPLLGAARAAAQTGNQSGALTAYATLARTMETG